ncbi:hypothetical protein GP486_006238 [Trichoglossum hirsutum]|uniref:Uncharacterized protein n=1 Tax=Trichoglossum hirsutum TaxID=265104 RepID=A0A9P8IHE8_9PEZI|nr:hypothetical protein GP486_006238 [Trichoglossum hirsutum]
MLTRYANITAEALFRLRASFLRLSIREKLAKVKKKLLEPKNRKDDRKPPTEGQLEQAMSPVSTPAMTSGGSQSPDGTLSLRNSTTNRMPPKCLVAGSGTSRPGAVPIEAGPSSIPLANPISTIGGNVSSGSLLIRDIDLHVASGDGQKEIRRAILDTGAAISIMAKDVKEDLGYMMEPTDELIFPFNSEPIPALGLVKNVEWNFPDGARTFVEDFYVVDTDEFDTLIGYNCLWVNGILGLTTWGPPTDVLVRQARACPTAVRCAVY